MKAVTDEKKQILARAHESLPEAFSPCQNGSIEVLEDIVAIRLLRPDGVRVEQETVGDQRSPMCMAPRLGGIYSVSVWLKKLRS